MQRRLGRRKLICGTGAALLVGALDGCSVVGRAPAPAPLRLPPVRASVDRITRITVCTRPFRAQGPRLDGETIGRQYVVHNYGHGGSGWSLSWGSSALAVAKAMGTGSRAVGVIGCGALGLTSAILLQRAGAAVTIYAKELPPSVRSSLATGLWTPDSRICLAEHASPAFKQLWQQMARQSFDTYQSYLGLPGTPVEFIDSYAVSDRAGGDAHPEPQEDRPAFAGLQHELIPDLIPASVDFGPGGHNLGWRYLRRNTLMMFNLSAYTRLLLADFAANGGKIQIAEFHVPDDLARLPEKTLINATGYGARALFGDESVRPVRGQLTRAIPQIDVNYGLFYRGVSFVPRRDGQVFQAIGDSDYYGFDDAGTLPDRAEATRAVETIGKLFA